MRTASARPEGRKKRFATNGGFSGSSGYIWEWLDSTFENWQSEFLQLFTMVVLTAFLIHKGSHESRDSETEMQVALVRIEQQLEELREATVTKGAAK